MSLTTHNEAENNIVPLGLFGSSHMDSCDLGAVSKGMTILTQTYNGVEEEYCYIFNLGICIKMEEYLTVIFNSLHYHSGCQPTYSTDHLNKSRAHVWLSLIDYPPDLILEGVNTVALEVLPNGTLLPVGFDLQNPAT